MDDYNNKEEIPTKEKIMEFLEEVEKDNNFFNRPRDEQYSIAKRVIFK